MADGESWSGKLHAHSSLGFRNAGSAIGPQWCAVKKTLISNAFHGEYYPDIHFMVLAFRKTCEIKSIGATLNLCRPCKISWLMMPN